MDLEAAPYGGGRFPVEARMDNRLFVNFQLDVGVGDVWLEPLEKIATGDWLAFAGIPSASVFAISKEQQFAEKIHAYTLPRLDRQNSRVKDLVDLAFLISEENDGSIAGLGKKKIAEALKATFDRRATHPIPTEIPPPPENWGKPFAALAEECGLSTNLAAAAQLVQVFFKGLK